MLQHVDAMLIGVYSVDMVLKNGTVFLRLLLMHVAFVALCWLCWRCRHRNTTFRNRWRLLMTGLIDVATCWCYVDWCWQCWYGFKKIPMFFSEVCWLIGVARDGWCWLCWHIWQRVTGFETYPEPLMLVHLHVATWCYMLTSVDKCWWKCWI